MELFWLSVVAVMITVYVVLDGFDLGAGAIHLFITQSEKEKKQVFGSIGPVWDGNEVWLIAGGGTLFFAFPGLYASSFSGFYLPLMIVLWLLMFRGISIELRNHFDNSLWKPFWDTAFCLSSGLLAIFYGAALGNVVRGVPLEPSGNFFLPLWTDFGFGTQGLRSEQGGILDWYTILVGLLAFVTLAQHGAQWISYKTSGELNRNCRSFVMKVWFAVVFLVLVVTAATFMIQPQVLRNFERAPWGFVFPILAILGLAGVAWYRKEGDELKGFLASSLYIVGMMTSAAFGIFPYVLPSSTDPNLGLTLYNTAAAPYGLAVGVGWWVPGIILAVVYFIHTYRRFGGKVVVE